MANDMVTALLGGAAAPSVQQGVQNLGNASLNPNEIEEEKKKRQAEAAAKAKAEAEKAKSQGMKKGGYVKSADGCAKRGHTKGKMV